MPISITQAVSMFNTVKDELSGKAKFVTETGDTFRVQFNPAELRKAEKLRYAQIEDDSGSDATASTTSEAKKPMEYTGSLISALRLKFTMDTSAVDSPVPLRSKSAKDVSKLTAKFSKLVQINETLHRPPKVTFIWGSTRFEGMINSVNTTFTMFTSKGIPIRAQVETTIVNNGAPQKVALQSPDRTKTRILSEGTNLWALADQEYDDINQWRMIAKANGIMDPLDIPIGTMLNVPALKDL